MLRIRKKQMDVFQAIAEADFRLRLEEHLRELFPRLGDFELSESVDRVFAVASEYSITRESDVVRLAKLQIEHWEMAGEGEIPPQAARILAFRQVKASERLERLQEWLEVEAGR